MLGIAIPSEYYRYDNWGLLLLNRLYGRCLNNDLWLLDDLGLLQLLFLMQNLHGLGCFWRLILWVLEWDELVEDAFEFFQDDLFANFPEF